ncbi:ComEA family DNA-binding protein [Thalassotalea euphylliae]|uniref:ComEA family DNA-binding protein n=1 Tax=Thalassotalea euphylliae TaxID=1655234 RepID=UPI00362CC527
MNILKIAVLAATTLLPLSLVHANDIQEESRIQSVITTPISINKASVEQLTMLKGIGNKKAQAIVAYRESNGEFSSIEQLTEVKGIGDKIVADNRTLISL